MTEGTIQSVARTFCVLECLAAHGDMGVRELHGATGLSVTTVHRILSTLTSLGYVRQVEAGGRYALTYKMLVLGNAVTRHHDVVQLVHPVLRELSAQAGETVHFAQWADTNIRYIDKVVPSSGVVVMGSYLGMELPLHSTAVGKAILAKLPEEEAKRLWDRSERLVYTPSTIMTWEELARQLEQVRVDGVAYDYEEREPGISCVGICIVDAAGQPTWAVSISSTDGRMRESRAHYTQLLKQAGERITALIGQSV